MSDCIGQTGSFAKGHEKMYIEIDFNSEEALYLQLRNQIIIGIATSQFQEGDALPSVRQLADTIGINMHTVNKAYSVLKQEGFVKVDRRKGAVIAIDIDKMQAREDLKRNMQVLLAKSSCKQISREEVHALIDEIYEGYETEI
ncbi:HTH-type transcriptional repressor YtrA [Lachnospiraceae bacterium]|nr:HTH-type transcriptional repressor YtrA [Lachnospiraceae bacterium]